MAVPRLWRPAQSSIIRSTRSPQRAIATARALDDLQVRPIAGSLGAEIDGINARFLNDASIRKIHEAFLEHKVVFFRDQDLTPEQFLDFAANFGSPIEYPFVKGIDGYPEIIRVLKRENETANFGGRVAFRHGISEGATNGDDPACVRIAGLLAAILYLLIR